MSRYLFAPIFALLVAVCPSLAIAQGTSIAFGGLALDSSLPVEIGADSLQVDQATGQAVFEGNVDIAQGAMRLVANRVEVIYGTDTQSIARLVASGDVTLANGGEAVEAQNAEYDLETSQVILSGNVLLTQGASAISGERMVVDLSTGTGRIDGRVRTILQSGTE